MTLQQRMEIKDGNEYEGFIDRLHPSSVHHCEIVYQDKRRGEVILGRLHNYDSATEFAADKGWSQRHERYKFLGPRDVRVYAVVDWPEIMNSYETSEVVVSESIPERPFALRPAFG